MVIVVEQTIISGASWWDRRTYMEQRVIIFSAILAFINITLIIALCTLPTNSFRNKNVQVQVICLTSSCNQTAVRLLYEMDLSKDPCDDFYQFACGGFLEKTTLTSEFSFQNFFTLNKALVDNQIKDVLEQPAHPKEIRPFLLMKQIYKVCMNTTAIQKDGLTTLKEILKELAGWPVLEGESWDSDIFEWKQWIYKLRKFGFTANYLLSIKYEKGVIFVQQPKLNVQEAELVKGLESKTVRSYYKCMVDVAVFMGANKKFAREQMKKVLDFEIKLAKFYLNINTSHQLMNISKLQEEVPDISWEVYIYNALAISKLPVNDAYTLNTIQTKYLNEVLHFMAVTPKRVIGNYLMWKVVTASAPYLTEDLQNIAFKYSDTLHEAKRVRWKYCLNELYNRANTLTWGLYIRKHLNNEINNMAEEITGNVRNELVNLIKTLNWMDDNTRKNAIQKTTELNTIINFSKLLLNDNWLTEHYSKLEINSENFLRILLNLSLFEREENYSQVWNGNLKTNLIRHYIVEESESHSAVTMLAVAVVQGIFFNENRPQYMNYGSVGFQVGREIAHAFDEGGSKYAPGVFPEGWSNYSKTAFEKKGQCFVKQYSSYDNSTKNLYLNGSITRGESIAYNLGIRAAYLAYKHWSARNGLEPKLPGLDYSPNQLFWISTANTWCTKYSDKYLKDKFKQGNYLPSFVRIRELLRNSEYFSQDFNCPVGSKMNPERKCGIW